MSAIKKRSFSELKFKEREHLQEWIAKEPNSLGEELLIIQKEFDGFDDTRERLDLLAIDTEGQLVIIENKLDDSGRDVVWQALKYASYCSNLKKNDIVRIFQQYLEKEGDPKSLGDVEQILSEFFNVTDLEEVKLNPSNSQRVIFVAANFRKEVTSTVLWLRNQSLNIKCIKATPFQYNDNVILNLEQILPTPETEEMMIGIAAKELEEKETAQALSGRHQIRKKYWTKLLDFFQDSDCNLYDNISPSKDHWLNAGSGMSSCSLGLVFGKKEIRVELNLAKSETDLNKKLFDHFFEIKSEIELEFGEKLDWLRLDKRKSSRIEIGKSIEGFNESNWQECIEWHLDKVQRMDRTFRERLKSFTP